MSTEHCAGFLAEKKHFYSPSPSFMILLFGMSKRMASEETGWKPVCRDRRGRLSSQIMMTLNI
jgi:hypothetical protein